MTAGRQKRKFLLPFFALFVQLNLRISYTTWTHSNLYSALEAYISFSNERNELHSYITSVRESMQSSINKRMINHVTIDAAAELYMRR